jgi:hypoxia up-regulated 1
MPRVQALLREFIVAGNASAAEANPLNILGQHLNGDEAMALGAAFVAANKSSSFRVRKVGMVDAYPWPIGVRLSALSAPAGAAGEGAADAPAAKAWSKRSSLFRAYNPLESVKRVSFAAERDLRAVLFYEATPKEGAAPLPEGTPRQLAVYNVTGVEAVLVQLAAQYNTTAPNSTAATPSASEDASASATASGSPTPAPVAMMDPATGGVISGPPKVHVSFELDANGVARLLRAEATIDEEYVVYVTPTPVPTPSAASTSASASASGSGSASASDAASASPSDSAAATSASASSSKAADASASSTASADASASGSASPSPSVSPIAKLMKRTLRFPLTVVVDTAGSLAVQPMSTADKAAAFVTVRRLAKADEEKRAREGAKNSLEAYIYATREKLGHSDVEEGLPTVTTPDQREAMSEGLMGAEDWLYDEGA